MNFSDEVQESQYSLMRHNQEYFILPLSHLSHCHIAGILKKLCKKSDSFQPIILQSLVDPISFHIQFN